MKDLIKEKLVALGCTDDLFEKLYEQGETPYVAWYVRTNCPNKKETGIGILEYLHELSAATGHSFVKLKYAYFSRPSTPLAELARGYGYEYLRKVLTWCYKDSVKMFDELLPYCHQHAVSLVIDLALENGETIEAIEVQLDVSQSYVYKRNKQRNERLIDGGK